MFIKPKKNSIFVKKFIINFIYANKLFYFIFIKFQFLRSKFHFVKKTTNLKANKILTQPELIFRVKSAKINKCSEICHIIGSGWSLNESISTISDKDFVIGFNYAGLIGINFDVYFVEFGGVTVKNISYQHLSIVKDYVMQHTDLIFFKNLWEDKNDVTFINDHWLSISTPIKDRIYPVHNKKHLKSVIEAMLSDQSDYLPQMASSVVTSIILAYKAGFKKIVIHGLDFGGQYFFEVDDFQVNAAYIPDKKPEGGFYGKTEKNAIHPTASSKVGMKAIIPLLSESLGCKGVGLFSAILSSPVSKVLPVYKNGV